MKKIKAINNIFCYLIHTLNKDFDNRTLILYYIITIILKNLHNLWFWLQKVIKNCLHRGIHIFHYVQFSDILSPQVKLFPLWLGLNFLSLPKKLLSLSIEFLKSLFVFLIPFCPFNFSLSPSLPPSLTIFLFFPPVVNWPPGCL